MQFYCFYVTLILVGVKNYMAKKSIKPSVLENSNIDNSVLSTIAKLTDSVESLTKEVSDLKAIIKEKDEVIAKLMERISKNSSNSHKPSSSNFFNKPNPKPSRINKGGDKKKLKSGGQKGHTGSTMVLKETSDVVENIMPASCSGCTNYEKCKFGARVCSTRYKVDIAVNTIQTEYNQLELCCPLREGATLRGEYPNTVNAPLMYGEELRTFVTVLSTYGMMSQSRISDLLKGAFNISMSDGTVSNILESVATKCSQVRASIDERVLKEPVIHIDETGLREKGKINWMHTASTSKFTSLHTSAKRGSDGMNEIGLLKQFKGIGVHDCLAAYFSEDFDFDHALCNAHLDRELQSVLDNTTQKWPKKMQKLLSDMYVYKSKLLSGGITTIDETALQSFTLRWDKIVNIGYNQNPIVEENIPGKRGRKKRGKIVCLLDRMRAYKNSFMKFILDFRVPFSNNIAEKSFRLSKQKIKIAGSFRSEGGADNFATIFSVIDTFRKNGFSPIHIIKDIISGNDVMGYLV